jgi:hypothetical protein
VNRATWCIHLVFGKELVKDRPREHARVCSISRRIGFARVTVTGNTRKLQAHLRLIARVVSGASSLRIGGASIVVGGVALLNCRHAQSGRDEVTALVLQIIVSQLQVVHAK